MNIPMKVDKISMQTIDFNQSIILAAIKVIAGIIIASMITELQNTWAFLSQSVNTSFVTKTFFLQNFELSN